MTTAEHLSEIAVQLAQVGATSEQAASSFARGVAASCASLRDALYIIYVLEGAPYGNTEEGFQRWMRESDDSETE
jgi:hypothetical protein